MMIMCTYSVVSGALLSPHVDVCLTCDTVCRHVIDLVTRERKPHRNRTRVPFYQQSRRYSSDQVEPLQILRGIGLWGQEGLAERAQQTRGSALNALLTWPVGRHLQIGQPWRCQLSQQKMASLKSVLLSS